MGRLEQKTITFSKVDNDTDIEKVLNSVSASHDFIAIDYSPYELYAAYSIYDRNNVEYQNNIFAKNNRKILETYRLAGRIMTGNKENKTFYIDKRAVPVYCADNYYKDLFGRYTRLEKLAKDLENATGSKFILNPPDIETRWINELYDEKADKIIECFRDIESL